MAKAPHLMAVGMRRFLAFGAGLVLIVLATGVPVHAHAGHEGGDAHIGGPEHSHGFVIVQQDMRAERPTALVVMLASPVVAVLPLPQLQPLTPPKQEALWLVSRAPPTQQPRAPPTH